MKLLRTYLGSDELKKVIIQRSLDFNIPFRFICHEIGVDYKHFMNTYINSKTGDNCTVKESEFEKILDILGIETRFQFIVKSNFKADRETLKEKYESAIQKKTSTAVHK